MLNTLPKTRRIAYLLFFLCTYLLVSYLRIAYLLVFTLCKCGWMDLSSNLSFDVISSVIACDNHKNANEQ